jgi:hypothetical protein
VINEAARAVSRLIRAYLIYDGVRGGLDEFVKRVAPKYLGDVIVEHLVKVLEIERAQKESPVEFAKGDKIILLIRGKYRVLTVGRICEFLKSVGDGVKGFPGNFRQV